MNWRDAAACKGRAVLFYADDPTPQMIAEAKAVCAECTVQFHCLNDAVRRGGEFGVRGGLTPAERQKLRGDKPAERVGLRVCRGCGVLFVGPSKRPTCDVCREEARRETWRLSNQRRREMAAS